MFDNNWKTWVLLLIAFFGVGIEVLKHLPGREHATVVWEKENLHYENKPYSVRNQLPKRIKLAPPARPAAHVAGDQKVLAEALKSYNESIAPQATEAEHKEEGIKVGEKDKDKKKKKNEDEYEEVLDPATGKMVKRKKKKEAKKEDEKPKTATASATVTPTEPVGDDEPTDAAAIAAAIAAAADTGDIPLPLPKRAADPFMSLQDWERLLLSRPDLAETKVFIQAFKNHTVSNDIYYTIAKMMIADSRPEMKSLGVMVAGSNPSVLSFQLLAGVSANSSGDPKSNAQKYLTGYSSSLANLQVLLGVLRGNDSVASAEALRQLDIADSRFLANTTTSTGGTSHGGGNAAQFQPFLAVLTTLSHSGDGNLASQATSSLNRLASLLGTTGTQIAAQTP